MLWEAAAPRLAPLTEINPSFCHSLPKTSLFTLRAVLCAGSPMTAPLPAPTRPLIALQPPFAAACINPDLNCDPKIFKFSVQPSIAPPPHPALLGQAAALQLGHSAAALEACVDACLLATNEMEEGDTCAKNFHAIYASSPSAEDCLLRIAKHRCAYASSPPLDQPAAKARDTFLSMQGPSQAAPRLLSSRMFQPPKQFTVVCRGGHRRWRMVLRVR